MKMELCPARVYKRFGSRSHEYYPRYSYVGDHCHPVYQHQGECSSTEKCLHKIYIYDICRHCGNIIKKEDLYK